VVFNSVLLGAHTVLLGAHVVPPGNGEYPHGKIVVASAAREIVAGEQDVRAQFPVVTLNCGVGNERAVPSHGVAQARPEGRGVADDCPPPWPAIVRPSSMARAVRGERRMHATTMRVFLLVEEARLPNAKRWEKNMGYFWR